MRAVLYRTNYEEKETLGELHAGDDVLFTLELPNLNDDGIEGNERRKSCIPEGVYPVVRHNSPKFGKCFWVKDVPGRDGILIHPGNYHWHTLGCILVGIEHEDRNKDGLLDVVSSRRAMDLLLKHDITELEVTCKND